MYCGVSTGAKTLHILESSSRFGLLGCACTSRRESRLGCEGWKLTVHAALPQHSHLSLSLQLSLWSDPKQQSPNRFQGGLESGLSLSILFAHCRRDARQQRERFKHSCRHHMRTLYVIHVSIYIYIYIHIMHMQMIAAVYVCVCVSMCIYVHTCIYIYTYVGKYAYIYINSFTYIHACMHACMHTYILEGAGDLVSWL